MLSRPSPAALANCAETLMSPSGSAANLNSSMAYDSLNHLSTWLVIRQAGGAMGHDYVYQRAFPNPLLMG